MKKIIVALSLFISCFSTSVLASEFETKNSLTQEEIDYYQIFTCSLLEDNYRAKVIFDNLANHLFARHDIRNHNLESMDSAYLNLIGEPLVTNQFINSFDRLNIFNARYDASVLAGSAVADLCPSHAEKYFTFNRIYYFYLKQRTIDANSLAEIEQAEFKLDQLEHEFLHNH